MNNVIGFLGGDDMSYGFNAYKQTSVSTASREKVLLMLYEGAIRFNKKAINHLENNELSKKGEVIGRLQDVINELNNSLDHEVGGEISQNLEALYNFMIDQITEANIKNEVKPLKTTLSLLETLYDGWKQAVEEVQKQGGLSKVQVPPKKAAAPEKDPQK
jgi:flagellar protein FliS